MFYNIFNCFSCNFIGIFRHKILKYIKQMFLKMMNGNVWNKSENKNYRWKYGKKQIESYRRSSHGQRTLHNSSPEKFGYIVNGKFFKTGNDNLFGMFNDK